MKKKRTYSLTAKERKAKRLAEQGKTAEITQAENQAAPSREDAEKAMLSSQKRSKGIAFIVGGVCAIAIILILVALIVPVYLHVNNPYRGYGKVIARFNLSNGMVLEYVIDEDQYDTAATNFIFLAQNGYFDNTVFYDAQRGWLRFGGYEAQPTGSVSSSSDYNITHHHKDNKSFCENFAALENSKFNSVTYKFGYRLRADNKGTEALRLREEGVLAFLYSDTATEFQFSYQEDAVNQIDRLGSDGNKTTYELNPTMVGHALNSGTLDNIKKIAATSELNENISSGYLWCPPKLTIKIQTVKVYNLNSSKWRDFDFISYMSGTDSSGINRLSQWIGRA